VIRELLGWLADALRGVGMLMAIGFGASIGFLVCACGLDRIRTVRSRCHICRTPAEVRFHHVQHGQVCDACHRMQWHRVINVPARDK
jgi:hypothetical protein